VVFVVVLGSVFVTLGDWQLDRLDQRRQRNTTTVANGDAPVRPYREIFTRPIGEADQWLRVQASGTFDADHQFVVRYRSNSGERGYEVVTPLRTSAGAVLVDRGFVPLARGVRIPTTAPPPPTGHVTVLGHVRRNEMGRRGAIVPSEGQVRLINSAALSAVLPYPVADGYIGALTIDPPQPGDFQPVAIPEVSEGPHFWYAVQWFMFAAIGAAGVVVFIRADLRERTKTRQVQDHAAP
jgi:cytochrome oxidase assembly protein ShyY1